MKKIASFTIDHIKLQPGIYVSRKDYLGDQVITTFDIRMTSPNEEPVMNTAELHAMEHLAATFLRNHAEFGPKVIYWGPMGCRTGNYLLLAGDYNQIPSVGPGQVLRDLVECGRFIVYRLTQTIRQKAGSRIVSNAIGVLNGKMPENGNDFEVQLVENDHAMMQAVKNLDMEHLPQILIPIKKGQAGTWAVNNLIQERFAFTDPGFFIDGRKFHEGDMAIMNQNNYDCGYMNGDVGQITYIGYGSFTIVFADKTLKLSVGKTDGMTLAYALTFHKSQGAEADNVLILLPSESAVMASRELLYTAITRAKKKVRMIAVPDVLDAYLAAAKRSRRNCGLRDWLMQKIM